MISSKWRHANGRVQGGALRLSMILALTGALNACGGGGGSGSSGNAGSDASAKNTSTATNTPTTTTTNTGTTNTTLSDASPDVVVTPDSAAYAAMVSTDLVTQFIGNTDHTPTVITAPAWTLSGDKSGLVLSSSSTGQLSSSLFLGNQTLPPISIQLAPSTQTVQGQSTIQFLGFAVNNLNYPYAASVQWFTGSGITAVGLGQWKYMGEQQTTIAPSVRNSGRQLSAGAFLMGTPTAPSALSNLAGGQYVGQMQALVDDGRYGDDFNHLTAKVTATLDVAKAQVTLQLTNPGLLVGFMGTTGILRSSWTEASGTYWMPEAATCTGSIDLQNGHFSCTFSGPLSGTVQGQLFGAEGDQLAATFSAAAPSYGMDVRPVVVGGLAAKRTSSLP